MKVSARTAIAVAAITIAAVLYAFDGGVAPLNPFAPEKPRPILQAIAKAAKLFLWMAFVAEPPPQEQDVMQHSVTVDGYPTISHGASL